MAPACVRICLIGSKGRMGQTIAGLTKRDPAIDLVAECDIGDSLEKAIPGCDVAIDFSNAAAIVDVCAVAVEHGKPLVIGTTGHTTEQRRMIEQASASVPIVFASNFSIGVNALFWLTRKAAELLGPDFSPSIIEVHHTKKKDAPSGTAKTLAEIFKKAGATDLPIKSVREGEVVGDHTVTFTGPGERLELIHRAETREIFARGALKAAQWVTDKPPRLYSMQDVLGL